MTEKRFQDIGGYITDIDSYCCTKVYEKTSDIIDLLNTLYEENQLLIKDSEKYRKLSIQFDNRNKELIEENTALKSANLEYKNELAKLEKENDILLDEYNTFWQKKINTAKNKEGVR